MELRLVSKHSPVTLTHQPNPLYLIVVFLPDLNTSNIKYRSEIYFTRQSVTDDPNALQSLPLKRVQLIHEGTS